MISRVDLLNKIIYTRKEFKFPRVELKCLKSKRTITLPTDQQIMNAMKLAREDALRNSAKFHMDCEEDQITNFDTSLLNTLKLALKGKKSGDTEGKSYIGEACEEDASWGLDDVNVLEEIFNMNTNLDTKQPSENENPGVSSNRSNLSCDPQPDVCIDLCMPTIRRTEGESNSRYKLDHKSAEMRSFVEVINDDGTITNVKKSTFVWKLLESKGKLSSDRLKRVQGTSHSSEPQRKRRKECDTSLPNESGAELGADQILFQTSDIEICEWVVLKENDEDDINIQNSKTFIEKKMSIWSCFRI